MRNAMFIVDEFHLASDSASKNESPSNQTLSRFMFNMNLVATPEGVPDKFLTHNIKFVYISATPEGSWKSFNRCWGPSRASVCVLDLPQGKYHSIEKFLKNRQVYQARALVSKSQLSSLNTIQQRDSDIRVGTEEEVATNMTELFSVLKSFDEPKYHIIRSPRTRNGNNYRDLIMDGLNSFADMLNMGTDVVIMTDENLMKMYSLSSLTDCLQRPPKVHTFVVIHDLLKCAITLPKRFIGILYERCAQHASVREQLKYSRHDVDPDCVMTEQRIISMANRESFVVQSLLGRATGFGHPSVMDNIVIFTDILLAETYVKNTVKPLSPDELERTKRHPSRFYQEEPLFFNRPMDWASVVVS
jgi:hypothetical protein